MPAAKDQKPAEPAEAEAPDPRDAKIADLERQLEEARRPRLTVTGGQPVRLKVKPPHSELHYAGHVIGREYTEVPANLAAAFMEAAADAGVALTQDQES